MKNQLLLSLTLFFLALLGGVLDLKAQTKAPSDGKSVITYENLKSKKTLTELFPEIVGSNIISYTYTFGCDGKNLEEGKCTGDTLPKRFFAYADKSYPTRCTLFFDKIIAASANGEQIPITGRIIELVK